MRGTLVNLKGVGVLVVLAQIDSDLLFIRDPEAHDCIHDLQQDQRPHKGQDPGGQDCDRFMQLAGIAEEEPIGPVRLTALEAKSPVARAPQVPPTPCTPTTSSESS